MRISDKEKTEFIEYLRELLLIEQVHDMRNYIQHGKTNTFTHCLMVAYYSYLLSLRLPINFNSKSIVRGALLHDFYLYDWHIPKDSPRLHGFVHPNIALMNAKKHFQINRIEEDIIKKHMWPLTLHKLPSYKETYLVLMVDKYVSMAETLYLPILQQDYNQLQQELTNSNKQA